MFHGSFSKESRLLCFPRARPGVSHQDWRVVFLAVQQDMGEEKGLAGLSFFCGAWLYFLHLAVLDCSEICAKILR